MVRPMTIATMPTFVEALRDREKGGVLYEVLLIVAGSAMIAASAQVVIPLAISPVPITGQTFAVLLVGALYGAPRGAATVLAYLLQGAVGFPVFAGFSAGAGYLIGPSGGYLVGFLPAAWLVGVLAQRGWDRDFVSAVVAMTIGNAVIYIVGAVWLAAFIDADLVLRLGVVPFLPGAAIKIVLAALVLPTGWRILTRVRERSTSPPST